MNDVSAINPIDLTLGRHVRLRREMLGMSQAALARKIGVKFQQVQKYEKGVNRIAAGRLFEIAAALHTPIQYFYEDMPAPLPHEACQPQIEECLHALLETREGRQMISFFALIESQKVRLRVVELTRVLSQEGETRTEIDARGRQS